MVGNVSCQTVIKETRFLSHPFFDSILNFLLSLKTATTYFQIIFPKLFVFAKAESHTYCLRTSIKFCKILLCVKVFILTFKFHIDSQSIIIFKNCFKGNWFICNSAHNFLQFGNIRKSIDFSFIFLDDSLSSKCGPSFSSLILISPVTWIS